MTHENDNDNQSLVDRLVAILLQLRWTHVLGDALKALRNAIQGRSYRGLYEVLEYESTLELKDREGKKATFKKREKVRYLQDNVIAYQDQAWGDGEILLNYRCAPGIPVDQYRSGYKTYILISRRELKDNSTGFDPRRGYPGRLGLQSMEERAARAGGALSVHSAPAHGTMVRVRIPPPQLEPGP
jgi:hypothetical protein